MPKTSSEEMVEIDVRLEAIAVSIERLRASHVALLAAAELSLEHVEAHGTCLGPTCVAENEKVRAVITQAKKV